MIMNDVSLIYILPSASRTIWAKLTSFLPFSLYLSSSTFLGLLQLFNGSTCLLETLSSSVRRISTSLRPS